MLKNKIFILVFSAVLLLPMIGQFSGISNKILPSSERRKLAQLPQFQKEIPKTFVKKIDAWYKDNFGFRNVLFRGYSALKYHGFKVSPLPERLIRGEEGWVYSHYLRGLKTVNGKPGYPSEVLALYKLFFEEKHNWLAEKGIRFYLAVAPSKFTACKDYLPDYLKEQNMVPPTDQLANYLAEKSAINFVNLKKGFPPDSNACKYYRKADSHWNMLGAFWGADYLLKTIQKDFPQIPSISLEDFVQKPRYTYRGGQAQMINLPILEEDIRLTHQGNSGYKQGEKKRPVPQTFHFLPDLYEHRFLSTRPQKTNLKVMIFHDSFGIPFQYFLSKCFDEVVFFRITNNLKWWNEELILQEAPDIVIFERAELNF